MMSRPQSYTEGEAAASHHERANRSWKQPSERVVPLVLVALLAAALLVIYRLSVINSQVKTLQALKEENEALRKNLSECKSAHTTSAPPPSCPPPPTCPLPSACPPSGGNMNERCLKCEADWEHHGGKCYHFTTTRSSWEESRDGCRGKGGDLVKIDSREEQIFLETRLRDKMEGDEDKFWIGLTDSEEEGRWLWADGSFLDTCLSFWNPNEPDNLSRYDKGNLDGADCVRMGEHGGAADLSSWFDTSCNIPHKSICEKAAETK